MNFYNSVSWNPNQYSKPNYYYAPKPVQQNEPGKEDTAKKARFTLSNAYGSRQNAPMNSSFHANTTNETPRGYRDPTQTVPIPRQTTRSLSQERPYESHPPVYVNGAPFAPVNLPPPLLSRSRINEIENTLQNVHQQMIEVPSNPTSDNATLIVSEVDKVLRILSQIEQKVTTTTSEKNTEAEIWRSKYEHQVNLSSQLQANFERELKNQVDEINRLNQVINAQQIEQVRTTEMAKSQVLSNSTVDLDEMKKSHMSSISLYEEQVRKLREIIEDREKEIGELNSKVNQHKNLGESESNRLNQDKGKLMQRITNLELEQEKNMETLKSKISGHYNDQISNLKNLHLNEIHVLEDEINQIKRVLDLKNDEITTMIEQNKEQKYNFDNDTEALRHEVSELKKRIKEISAAQDQEIRQLLEKLSAMHAAELQNLRIFHQNQIESLCSENEKLKSIIKDKNIQIDIQTREKIEQSNIYKDEKSRLEVDIEKLHLKLSQQERQHEGQLTEAQARFNRSLFETNEHIKQQTDHIKYLEEEINNFKSLVNHKNIEYEKLTADREALKAALEHEIANLKTEINSLVQQYEGHISELNMIIEELKHKLQLLENSSFEKIRDLESTVNILQHDLVKLQDTLEMKHHENNDLTIHKHQLEEKIRRMDAEIDYQNQQVIHLDRSKAIELEEIRVQIESTSGQTIDAMRKTHSNQIKILLDEKENLRANLEKKSRDVTDLLAKYEQLVAAYSNGEPFNSDLNATKAIFESGARSQGSKKY